MLVARLDNLGDVLLAGPAVRAVARRASVTLLCGPHGADAARLLPGVGPVLVFRAPWIDPAAPPVDRAAVDGLVRTVAAGHFDEALVLTSFHQSALPLALVLRLAGVPRVAAVSDDYPGSLLDVRHAVADDVHEVERNLSLAAAAGYDLAPDDDARLAVRLGAPPDLALPAGPYVVVHPGASVPARALGADRLAAAVERLAAGGWPVVVTGGPAEAALAARVAGTSALDLAGRTDLGALGHVLAGAAAVVTGNTGPAHLAAAVGTPVVSIFPPTVPAVRWRPWGVPHVLLGDQAVACAGCRARICPVAGQPCLAGVTPDDVAAAVATLARRPVPA